ncbi:MAG: HEAT repeat domain-containing protein [Planctomycetota bacterium]
MADLSLLPFEEAKPELERALASSRPWERYWALIACSCFGEEAKPLAAKAKERLDDPELLVRVRAAEFLGIIGAADPRPTLYDVLNTTESPVEALLTFNTAVFFHDRRPGGYPFDLTAIDLKAAGGRVGRRISYLKGP